MQVKGCKKSWNSILMFSMENKNKCVAQNNLMTYCLLFLNKKKLWDKKKQGHELITHRSEILVRG